MKPILEGLQGLVVAAGAAPIVLFGAVTSASAIECHARAEIVQLLTDAFQEKQTGFGMTTGGGELAELFVSKAGTWTLIVSTPRGDSCVVAAGENWERTFFLDPEA